MKKLSKKAKIIIVSICSFIVLLVCLILFTDLIISTKYKLAYRITRHGLINDIFESFTDGDDFSFKADVRIDDFSSEEYPRVSIIRGTNVKIRGSYDMDTKSSYSDMDINYKLADITTAKLITENGNIEIEAPELFSGYISYHTRMSNHRSNNKKKGDDLLTFIKTQFKRAKVKKLKKKQTVTFNSQSYDCDIYKATLGAGEYKGYNYYLYIDKHGNLIRLTDNNIIDFHLSPKKSKRGYYTELTYKLDTDSDKESTITFSMYLKIEDGEGEEPIITGTEYNVNTMHKLDYIPLLIEIARNIKNSDFGQLLQELL